MLKTLNQLVSRYNWRLPWVFSAILMPVGIWLFSGGLIDIQDAISLPVNLDTRDLVFQVGFFKGLCGALLFLGSVIVAGNCAALEANEAYSEFLVKSASPFLRPGWPLNPAAWPNPVLDTDPGLAARSVYVPVRYNDRV